MYYSLRLTTIFTITMTKSLDAVWLKSVQFFHELYGSAINDLQNEKNDGKVFQQRKSHVSLIPNCTRHRNIYRYFEKN